MNLRPELYEARVERVGEWSIRLTSYKLGNLFFCVADNVDPGAVLSRGTGETREQAESAAREKARHMVQRTRVIPR